MMKQFLLYTPLVNTAKRLCKVHNPLHCTKVTSDCKYTTSLVANKKPTAGRPPTQLLLPRFNSRFFIPLAILSRTILKYLTFTGFNQYIRFTETLQNIFTKIALITIGDLEATLSDLEVI